MGFLDGFRFGTKTGDKYASTGDANARGVLALLKSYQREISELQKRVSALEALVKDVRPDLEERLYDPDGVQVSRKAAESIRSQWTRKDQETN